jgi:hypothetical protein
MLGLVEDSLRPLQRHKEDEKKEPMDPKSKEIEFSERDVPTRRASLQRAASEPVACRRRSIFEPFWQKSPVAQRPRSCSDVVRSGRKSPRAVQPQRKAVIPQERASIPPSKTEIVASMCSNPSAPPPFGQRFRDSRDMPSVKKVRDLPTIPLPLHRFYNDNGTLACLSGAYPLNSPRSILRRRSYDPSLSLSSSDDSNSSNDAASPTEVFSLFNLTRSTRFSPENTAKQRDANMGQAVSASSICSSDIGSRHVRFDPRVTVIEYPDNIKDRTWYSEDDLDRFRTEMIGLAHQYLLKHPKAIKRYNTPMLDPVTGTMRKKALFSLEVFKEADECDGQDGSDKEIDSMKCLADREVKTILIVDRNKLILGLFSRSIRCLFPHARIETCERAEDALQFYESARADLQEGVMRGVDIVIAEERLNQPLPSSGRPIFGAKKETCLPQDLPDLNASTSRLRRVSELEPSKAIEEPMSGAELFQRILEADELNKQTTTLVDASSVNRSRWSPLLIAVSTCPKNEEKMFLYHGADLVWGKPPPCIDDCLRD